jgi:hypothetical protein
MSGPALPLAFFRRTREGLLAGRVGDHAFLGLPAADGALRVAYGSAIAKALELWTPGDFYGVSRLVEGEAGFRAYVEEQAEHRRAPLMLERHSFRSKVPTPWGCSDFSCRYAEGVVRHSAPSHGGFQLDATRDALVHPAYRNGDGWDEEDCQWSKVAATFPNLFTGYERRCAHQTLRNSEPDAYELVNGVSLAPGESHVKDERKFERDHASDWIVISALPSAERRDFVDCVATIGGKRESKSERRFLVPSDEYEVGRFGFVIDPARHVACDGGG